MSGPNHVAGGLLLTGIYLSMWDVNIYSQPHFLFFTAFFSLLPDIDHTRSILGKPFYPLSRYLDKRFGHRTITHSLLCYFLLGMCISVIEKVWFESTIISTIYLWSYASHLILDMLTVQGIPLLYPFKKNPCVIPGNPKYRLRSSSFKTESAAFVIFIMLSFTCKDLFAHGFWNTYDRAFGTIKSVHAEQLLTDKGIEVAYDVVQNGTEIKGTAMLVSSTGEGLLLFNEGFIQITKADRIRQLTPQRVLKKLVVKEMQFTGISFDSLQKVLKNLPILSLKLQATLPIQYTKDNAPQSSTGITLENVYNPVLQSSNIDSLDNSTAKELSLLQLELQAADERQRQYEQEKAAAFAALQQVEAALSSDDLAEREEAIKGFEKVRNKYEAMQPPLSNKEALGIRLQFLRSNLHIKKIQSINGFISYLSEK